MVIYYRGIEPAEICAGHGEKITVRVMARTGEMEGSREAEDEYL